jgi:hypothetical protein
MMKYQDVEMRYRVIGEEVAEVVGSGECSIARTSSNGGHGAVDLVVALRQETPPIRT